jgi:transcriptional regulator with XRE-family HTH domain
MTRPQPKRIAEKLLAIRRHLALSQTEMKERLHSVNHYGRISEYELGRRVPTILTLLGYARAAKVPLEHIVDDEIELKFTS